MAFMLRHSRLPDTHDTAHRLQTTCCRTPQLQEVDIPESSWHIRSQLHASPPGIPIFIPRVIKLVPLQATARENV